MYCVTMAKNDDGKKYMRNSWEMNNISALPCCITTEYLATMHGTMHYSMYTAHKWASLAMHSASSSVGTTGAGAAACKLPGGALA